MIRFAARRKIVVIEEQPRIATMRLDVIHFGGEGMLPTLQTIHTPWFPGKLRRTHGLPLRTVVQLLDRRIADDAN